MLNKNFKVTNNIQYLGQDPNKFVDSRKLPVPNDHMDISNSKHFCNIQVQRFTRTETIEETQLVGDHNKLLLTGAP